MRTASDTNWSNYSELAIVNPVWDAQDTSFLLGRQTVRLPPSLANQKALIPDFDCQNLASAGEGLHFHRPPSTTKIATWRPVGPAMGYFDRRQP